VSTVVLGAVKNYSFGIVLYTIQHTPNTFDIQLCHAVQFDIRYLKFVRIRYSHSTKVTLKTVKSLAPTMLCRSPIKIK